MMSDPGEQPRLSVISMCCVPSGSSSANSGTRYATFRAARSGPTTQGAPNFSSIVIWGGRSRFSESFGTDQCAEVERELEAWDSIHDLLQSLIQLDELGETDPACFLTAVERGLDRPAGRIRRFGQGVFVGSLSVASGMDWDLAFVVGATERALPAAQREDPLLPEALRSEVGIALVADRARRQRSEYLAALWSAEEIQLSYPRADLRGQRARSTEPLATRISLQPSRPARIRIADRRARRQRMVPPNAIIRMGH